MPPMSRDARQPEVPRYGEPVAMPPTDANQSTYRVVRVHSKWSASVVFTATIRADAEATYADLVSRGACVALVRGRRITKFNGIAPACIGEFENGINQAIAYAGAVSAASE
jgi:hypothetical protein